MYEKWSESVSHSVVSNSWDPVDYSLPGSSVHGILPARILEWVAISFSKGSSPPRDQTWVSHIGGRFFTVWAIREALTVQSHLLKVWVKILGFLEMYVRGYCFSWDEYFGNERMSLLQYCNNSLGQNDLESRIPFPLEPLKIIMEEACHLLAKMD